MDNTIVDFEYDKRGCYSFRKIIAVTFPILLSMLMEHVIGLTDTAFLGRLSETALGASALGTVYFLIFFVLGTGFSFGAQILIARRNGEKNFAAIGEICYSSGFFLAVMAIALIAIICLFAPQMLSVMVSSPEVGESASQYLKWRAPGLFFAFIIAIFRAFYVGIAQTGILTVSSVVMVITNIVLNYALIFGKFGLPAMGIAGAAFASSIAEAIAMFCYIVHILKFIDFAKYGFQKKFSLSEMKILKNVFSISVWMMMQPFLSVILWLFFFLAVERLGERFLAVINLARALSSVPFVIVHACGTAVNTLTGNLIGEGKGDMLWRLIGKTSVCGGIIVLPMLMVFALFPASVLRIYTDNMDLIYASTNVVYVICLCGVIQIGAYIMFNAVSGSGAVKTVVVIEIISLLFYALFVWIAIIEMRVSPAIAWMSEFVYQVSFGILCFCYLLSGRWRNNRL